MDADSNNSTKKPFRQAVQEFDSTSKLFRQLVPFKDGIAELRRKRASFATIAGLLKDQGVVVSYKTVARFHQKFGPKKGKVLPPQHPDQVESAEVEPNGSVQSFLPVRRDQTTGPWTPRRRGPRISDSKNL